MENKFMNEMIEKAKDAETVEELGALAKVNGISCTQEQLENAFAKTHQRSGELRDDELDNVAGGCGSDPVCFHCGAKAMYKSECDGFTFYYCSKHKYPGSVLI